VGHRSRRNIIPALLVLLALGSTALPPRNDGTCPFGTRLDGDTGGCSYKVALAVPYNILSKATRAMGAYLALDHINSRNDSVVTEAELLPDGFKMEVVLLDSEFTASGGVKAAMQALDNGVVAVVGASRSSATIPLANIMLVSQAPVVSYASTSPDLSSQTTYPFFARTIPTDEAAGKAMARLMMSEFGWRRLGMLHVDDAYGSSYFQAFRSGCAAVAQELGLGLNEYQVTPKLDSVPKLSYIVRR
jgi:hypothetical protein